MFFHLKIYLEKKAAQERFLREQSSTGGRRVSESEPKPIDHVEFHQVEFQAKATSGATATNLRGSWQLPKRTEGRVEKQEIRGLSPVDGNLNRIEKLVREKIVQDMYSNGMTVVRLMKVIITLPPCAVNSSSSSDCLDHPSPMFSFCRHIS